MSERSCPVSGVRGSVCPAGHRSRSSSRLGPRGCSFSGFTQPGDLHTAFDIPRGVDVDEWLRARERKAINEILYSNIPSAKQVAQVKNVDTLTADDRELLAVALGAPARQVILRAEEIGPRTGWKDGYLSTEYGFCPPDANASAGALANSPGRVWSDLCERMPGCVSRGRVRESVAALPLVEGTEDVIPDQALWAAVVALGMLCSIYRYEDKNDGNDGVSVNPVSTKPQVPMADELGPELVGIPLTIGLPYWQISRRMGRAIPHLTFYDQASYNIKVRDPTSTVPYVGRFDNIDLRWPMFGERTEIAFLKGCADTAASFQHGPDAIAACQEHVMNRNVEGLLCEMIRLKEILERMPNAFHSISTNPSSGENYVSATEWVRWGKFSAPLSKRCPAASGLQFPPYLLMDAFLGRKKYDSFLGNEGLHLRAWLPSNLRAFIAAVEYHYSVPEFVRQSGDPRLMGVLDGIIEAYTGERGFMGAHRYKVFGILEVASKTGRTETNGASGGADSTGRPWELIHRQFSDTMKERLEPYRGNIPVEPHEMRGTFEECRYMSRIIGRSSVDSDPARSIAKVTLDLQDTGITFQPGDRLAVMPLNSWEECAKVAAALGLDELLTEPVALDSKWQRFAEHFQTVVSQRTQGGRRNMSMSSSGKAHLTVADVLRRGHLAPLNKDLVLKIHSMLRASSNTVLQVLATEEWPVRASLGDLLQAAVLDTPSRVWDQAFDLSGDLAWLAELVPVEVPRTYSISSYHHVSPELASDDSVASALLPASVDLTVSRSEYKLCSTFAGLDNDVTRCGVGSGFLNPPVGSPEDNITFTDENVVLVGVSRPVAFQLPLDGAAPCAYFAGGSGIAPFRSFWQGRVAGAGARSMGGRNILFLGVQSREKFCYEEELRRYVRAGLLELHLAFSRDSRGLVYDPVARDLVERRIEPRYIDALIAEQGATVCDLVMSKAQGGLGGYLYVCGSVAVFDSVMSGIRRAVYNHRAATAETADAILGQAFAERRVMLDVFMTPRPLPCNLPAIPLSKLAVNTGHRPGGRMWIGVHGSVYDITDFAPMHPGGTLIIRSNAGVDCSRSFDNLAHTNNPEVSSLLTKYFVGHLAPKPTFRGRNHEELSSLYDLWADYLRTTVETLVTHQFETDDILTSSKLWIQGSLINMLGVRVFYQHQSRLLQSGFPALFGAKFQELVLKLSFALANNSAGTGDAPLMLPDVLGTLSRAKASPDAAATAREVSRIGQLVCNSEAARFQERGIMAYANRSVRLDLELLEVIREDACRGMDAFDTLATVEDGDDDDGEGDERLTAIASFLLQLMERMAKRLEVFYSNLARHSIYAPEMEKNPARTRWDLVRRRIKDRSLFVLARNIKMETAADGHSHTMRGRGRPRDRRRGAVTEFHSVLGHIQQSIADGNVPQAAAQDSTAGGGGTRLNERHRARTRDIPASDGSELTSHENGLALRRMSQFIDGNMRAMRRLSRMPNMTTEQLMSLSSGSPPPPVPGSGLDHQSSTNLPPSPPLSSGRVSPGTLAADGREEAPKPLFSAAAAAVAMPSLNRRRRTPSSAASVDGRQSPRRDGGGSVAALLPSPALTASSTSGGADAAKTIQAMTAKLNIRARPGGDGHVTPPSATLMRSHTASVANVQTYREAQQSGRRQQRSSTLSSTSLRSFRLRDAVAERGVENRVIPTF